MMQHIRNLTLGLLALFAGAGAHAADTDLFAAVPPTGSDAPHVLLVMDNGSSFSANATFRCGIDSAGNVYTTAATVTNANKTDYDEKGGGVEQCALYSVIKSLDTSTVTVNIGIMMFNANQKSYDATTGTFSQACINGVGGCLMMPIVPLNSTTKPYILDYIKNWNNGNSGNYAIKAGANVGNGATMQEAWAYYFGRTGMSGRDYASVAPAAGCANKYVIYVGNAWGTQGKAQDSNSVNPLTALNGTHATTGVRATPTATTTQLASITDVRSFSCNGTAKSSSVGTSLGDGAYALNWARYMKGQGVTTFSVGITGTSCDAAYVAHMDKLGTTEVGGGKFYNVSNFDDLVAAFKTILSEIQSVNSVFAAVSLPVSVNTQGSYLNQVFVGMFRPQKNFLPRWGGNLKQYKLGLIAGKIRLQDATGSSAINNLTGFITECARAFWTPSTSDTYWALDAAGGCLTVADSSSSNYPDGNIVEKGAQAYVLRTPGGTAADPDNRKMYTCAPTQAGCTALTEFKTANTAVTQALLNSGGTDRDTLINWGRGKNTEDELDKGTSVYRPSTHGDVVHSRPIPLNHGTDSSPQIVVYYGANDGALRAVNGNRTADITSNSVTYTAGAELWSFMPPEFYGKIKRLRSNGLNLPEDVITYPGSTVTGATEKDYGIDGPITAFQGTVGGSTKSWVYATMRRGGRSIYAFDVTTPGAPALLWKRGCPNAANDTDCNTDYSQIGQTWSSLKSMYNMGVGSGATPLLITGGGYDTCEDSDNGTKNHNCVRGTVSSTPASSESSATRGNRIYVINAQTGAVVKAFGTERAVIADVTLVRDDNNMVVFGYTADMGGNVYRLNFREEAPANWTITKIASLGCASAAACTDAVANRKFMFAPSVATAETISATANSTYYILLGTGDREKPVKEYLGSKAVQNYFYMFQDRPNSANHYKDNGYVTGFNNETVCGGEFVCLNSLYEITSSADPTDAQLLTKPYGWALRLDSTEQVVTQAITIFGVVTFSTHQPAVTLSSACGNNLGTTRVYNVSYLNAASANGTGVRYEDVAGDGLPPSPVAGRVTLDDGTTVPFCIGCSKDSPLEGAPPLSLSSVVQPKGRLYWYIEK